VGSNDFNVSQNPTLKENANSSFLKGFVTGSDFSPYFTTIGLYNPQGQLLMIATMGSPIKKIRSANITIQVKCDFDGPFGSVTVPDLSLEEPTTITETDDGEFIWNHS
jgi:hypothetical protein